MPKGDDTATAIDAAMAVYEAKVLDERLYDVETGHYHYAGRITHGEVLKLAGLKSRSTLLAAHHAATRAKLDCFIRKLKVRTGKLSPEEENPEVAAGSVTGPKVSSRGRAMGSRIDELTQTVAALSYRIVVLQQENAALRKVSSGEKVVAIRPARGATKAP